MIEKIKEKIYYRDGLFRSRSDINVAKALNILKDKLNEIIEHLNKSESEQEREQLKISCNPVLSEGGNT